MGACPVPKPVEGAAELKTNGEGFADGAGAAREMDVKTLLYKMTHNGILSGGKLTGRGWGGGRNSTKIESRGG